jgi:hypothetical protein
MSCYLQRLFAGNYIVDLQQVRKMATNFSSTSAHSLVLCDVAKCLWLNIDSSPFNCLQPPGDFRIGSSLRNYHKMKSGGLRSGDEAVQRPQ